jgi:hypothetical protein
MENMGPRSPEMGKKALDLTGDRELRVREERKNFGCQFSSKYQGILSHFVSLSIVVVKLHVELCG